MDTRVAVAGAAVAAGAACAGPGSSWVCARTSFQAEGAVARMNPERPSGVLAWEVAGTVEDPGQPVATGDEHALAPTQKGGDKVDLDGDG